MASDFTAEGGLEQLRDLGRDLWWDITSVQHALARCPGQIAEVAVTLTQFVSAAYANYGPAIRAAIGATAFGSLTIFEALGVILTTLSAPELLLIAAAVGVAVLFIWSLYMCLGS